MKESKKWILSPGSRIRKVRHFAGFLLRRVVILSSVPAISVEYATKVSRVCLSNTLLHNNDYRKSSSRDNLVGNNMISIEIGLCADLGIDSGDVLHEVNNTSRVSVLVIVPGNKLDELRVEHDTGISIEDGRAKVTFEIGGDQRFIGVSKESLHFTFGQLLDVGADLFVGSFLDKSAGQVNDGDINGRNTESHTGKLSDQGRDDLGDSLGGTSGGRNDVSRGGTSSSPVLAGRRVNDGLGGSHGVNSGHEGHFDLELVVNSLDHRGKSVGGARSARDEVFRSVVFPLVDTHNNGLGVILGRGRVDDLLGSSINDGLGLLLGEEDTGGFADVVSAKSTPADFLRVTASAGQDLLSVQDQKVSIDIDSLLGLSVDGIVLVLVGHVVRSGTSGVDTLQVAGLVFHYDTGDKTSNTSESVDTHTSGGHGHGGIVGGGLEGSSREAVLR